MKALSVRWVAVALCVLACATVAVHAVYLTAGGTRVEDRNGDGRPDVWLRYDSHGERTEVDIDTNFDGRPDVQEYYQHDTLVRREIDRDFNGQTDLIEEFDVETGDHARSVVDVDNDGTADLLVLFRRGEPVFSKYVDSASVFPKKDRGVAGRRSVAPRGDRLAPLDDPFRADPSLSQLRIIPISNVAGLSTSGGLPASPTDLSASMTQTPHALPGIDSAASPHFPSSAPRAPPLS